MKDLITDAIMKKLAETLQALGGARTLFGDPIRFNGEEIVPVARVSVLLSAAADGAGGGNAGLASFAQLSKGGGGGNAEAGVRVLVEPVGFLRGTADGPVFCPLP
ncbi:MAG: hypothetical protein K0S46_1108 [Moraxellaceae bacterium]|jgi:uncharacterized spore protein YtfJ|nr:hypothetical protein [Moraxellaceae bacterium]